MQTLVKIPAANPSRNALPTGDAPVERPGRPELHALTLALLWSVVVLLFWFGLFVPSMRPGVSSMVTIDLAGYFLPKFVYANEQLARGSLPLWNPYEYGGVPFLGVGQPAALYPPRVIAFGLLPLDVALHGFMVFHYLVLGAGAFVMLRVFGVGMAGAVFGTLCLAFQPAMMNSHYNPIRIASYAWIPWMVATFIRTIEGRRGMALALAAAAALQVLAGYPEYWVDTAVVLAMLMPAAALRAGEGGRGTALGGVLRAVGAGLLAVAMTAPLLSAVVEAFTQSIRAADSTSFLAGQHFELGAFGSGLGAWVSSISTFAYLPALAWVLVFVGVVTRERPYRWALLAIWFFASIAYSAPLRGIPPFSFFRSFLPWSSLLYVPLATFAGAGFDRVIFWVMGGRPQGREALVALVALAASLPFLAARSAGWLVLTVTLLLVGYAVGGRGARYAVAAALAATLGTIWTWVPPPLAASLPHRYAAGQPPYPALADAIGRGAELRAACGPGAAGRLLAPVETLVGVPVAARLYAVQGYPEPLAPARMNRLLDAAGLAPDTLLALDWARVARARGVLRLLDVTCVVVEAGHEPTLAALGFALGGRLPDGRTAWVRPSEGIASLVPTVHDADAEHALAWLRDERFDVRNTAILETAAGTEFQPPPACSAAGCDAQAGSVTPVGLEAERLAFRVEAPARAHLVIATDYAPGWRATIDGRAAPIVRADYAFMAVAVEPGSHVVTLDYRPRGFVPALPLSVVGLIGLLAGAVRSWRAAREPRAGQSTGGGPAASSAA
jgi:Bacterial membrane protein YfhO